MRNGYYAAKLSGDRLRKCYEIASPRVRRYLEAEIRFVLARLEPADCVLELGCGYGRVALRLAGGAARIVGIDTSEESLALARSLARSVPGCRFVLMDAVSPAFREGAFDAVVCVQNGICAFGVDQGRLLRESLRLLRPGGRALFSTYAPAFWPERLRWFEDQAAAGLIGPIDRDRTGEGTIVCRDGFRAGSLSAEALRRLCLGLGVEPSLTTVDGSSLFCEILRAGAGPDRGIQAR